MAITQLRTLEEFLALDWPEDGRKRELVRGEVVEVPTPGGPHNVIASRLHRLLSNFVDEQLGFVFTDNMGYVLSVSDATYRVPDVSFVADERIPPEGVPAVWYAPPDLAAEVVSPSDRTRDVEDKVQDYLAAGVRLVWVFWPDTQTVTVHAPDTEPRPLTADDILDGGDVLPGFAVPVATLFAPYRSR